MFSALWPELIINLKQIVTGERISKYVVTAARLAQSYQHPLIVCVNNAEIQEAVEAIKKEDISLFDYFHIFGQSIDPVDPGASATGTITPRALAHLGAHGTLINHYEARIYGHNPGQRQKEKGEGNDSSKNFRLLEDTILAGLRAGLNLVVCADGPETAAEITQLISREEFKDRIYDGFLQRFSENLITHAYVEFERVFGRFPEGLSKGSFRRLDFVDTFFGRLEKETSQRSYENFKEPFVSYQSLMERALDEILLQKLRGQFYEPVIHYAYRRLAIAMEWDELIGAGISIVKEKPAIIRQSVQVVELINPGIPVYCGAGVETAQEILTAIQECGAVGGLAASAFAKPFREIPCEDSKEINWNESLGWQESVERYLREISEYHKVHRPLMEGPFDRILFLDEDLFGLRLRTSPRLGKLLESVLVRECYEGLSLFGKLGDGFFHKLFPHHIPELVNSPTGEVQFYSKGLAAFCLLREILQSLAS